MLGSVLQFCTFFFNATFHLISKITTISVASLLYVNKQGIFKRMFKEVHRFLSEGYN